MTPAELRRKAAEAKAKGKKIVDKAESEDREMNAEEETDVSGFRAEADSYERRAVVVDEFEATPATATEARAGARVESVPGGTPEEKRANFGDWLNAVDTVSDQRNDYRTVEKSRELLGNFYGSGFRSWTDPKRDKETRDLAANSGVTGGYLMPQEFYNQLMEVAAPTAIVRPRAMVLPMGAETITIPSLDQTTTQSAPGSAFYGGVIVTWTGESATIDSTQPGFRTVTGTLNECSAYTPVSRTLIQRSAISVEPLIYRLFGGALGQAEEYQFLRGNGVGKPLGIMNAPARVITGTARGSATAISFANARAVWVKALAASRTAGAWVVSDASESAVLDMAGTANSVMVPSGYYITGTGNAAGLGVNYVLLGRPVLISDNMPDINTDGDFNYFDFSHYLILDGGPPEVAASDDYLFRTGQRAFRIIKRVGGLPWLNDGITSVSGVKKSPFVSLKVQ